MKIMDKEWLNEVKSKANCEARDLEPWKSYFDLRANEMEIFLSLFDVKDHKVVLEIGCGNGFNSCVLSQKTQRIIATDLFWKDGSTHTQGMQAAKKLIDTIGVRNCTLLSCSGEELPFKSELFDMVFSTYTLEHIPEKKKMLADVRRVLKKDGVFVVIVPGFAERFFYPLLFYTNLFSSLFWRLFTKVSGKKSGSNIEKKETLQRKGSSFTEFRKRYSHFPLPEPHGSYKNYFVELKSYLPSNWKRLVEDNGFRVVDMFSTMVVPKVLLGLLFGPLSFRVYKRLSWIDTKTGRNPCLKNFGQNVCLILERK